MPDERRELLRHYLAALAYRTQKALRDAPAGFGDFRPQDGVRTPSELVRHMTSVLGYAGTLFTGGRYRPDPLPTLAAEIERFHGMLETLAEQVERGAALRDGVTLERLLQGPLADAMTHAGQLALLRRLAGAPVPPENFVFADIDPRRLGPEQATPARPDPRLLFVIGASGAGKTTAVRALERRALPAVSCFYFDSIGVPSPEEMERGWGSGERWQEDATRQWIERLATDAGPAAVRVLDGQTRPAFIRTHAASVGAVYRVVLFDCRAAVRANRLHAARKPELATERMENWANFLRREAKEFDLPIIDTSDLSVDAMTEALQQEVERLRSTTP